MNRKQQARAKLERRAARGPGFSNYAKRRLEDLVRLEEELARLEQEQEEESNEDRTD